MEKMMGIEFVDQEPQAVQKYDIVVAGRKVGDVELWHGSTCATYHAAISLRRVGGGNNRSLPLVQGFAGTREEAVMVAIENGRREAQLTLAKIAELEAMLAAE